MKTIATLMAALCVLVAAAAGEESPQVVKLGHDYEKARAATLAQLNAAWAAEADTTMKQFLQAGNLPEANRTAEFSKHLKDTDERNDLEGIVPPASPLDRLGNLQARYVRTREETLRRLNQNFAKAATDLQAAFMRAGDLTGANAAAAFLEQVKPPAVAVPTATPTQIPTALLGATPANVHVLLSKENEKKWEVVKGDWKVENNVLTGSGDSSRVFHQSFFPPFTLQFKIKVLEGIRPRVRFGPFEFANEGFETTFGLYPKSDGKLFHYERKSEYRVAIVVKHASVELLVDDKLVSTRPGQKDKIEMLDFLGGDSYSKGKTEFRDIIVTK